jgi:phosphatidate phosphatase PAH1
MLGFRTLLLSMLFACAVESDNPGDDDIEPVLPPVVDVSTPAVPDVRCAGTPDAGPSRDWRHTSSSITANLGDPHHRGADLIATTDDATHTISGKVTYGDLEKNLEDEDVALFACIDATWRPLGEVRTDDNGRFLLTLTGDARLPAGLRDLYLSVAGDRSGAEFIALVAPPGSPVIVSDVDGTLTASENAYPMTVAFGGDTPVQADAAATLMSAAVGGVSIVYVTARGDRFTQDTRAWFEAKGFPRGPVRMPTSIITLPGEDTIQFKTDALAAVAGFDLVAGFGNRATDVAAYSNAGLAPERIFIKLPEFTEELTPDLMAAKATGFELYDRVRTDHLPALMP